MDLSSLLSSSNNSFPYFYFVLLTSTMISVGISFARILTKGKNPVIKNVISFKFFKVIIMLILKLLVQSYILMMALKSIMWKFVSKGRKGHIKYIYTFHNTYSFLALTGAQGVKMLCMCVCVSHRNRKYYRGATSSHEHF